MNRLSEISPSLSATRRWQSRAPSGPIRPSQNSQRTTNIRFHIERVTLEGLPRANQKNVIAAMQQKLTDLATESPQLNWSKLQAPFRIDGGEISSEATSEDIGSHLATQIMRGLSDANNRSRTQTLELSRPALSPETKSLKKSQ